MGRIMKNNRTIYDVNHISSILLEEINRQIQINLISTLTKTKNYSFELGLTDDNKSKESSNKKYSSGAVL